MPAAARVEGYAAVETTAKGRLDREAAAEWGAMWEAKARVTLLHTSHNGAGCAV